MSRCLGSALYQEPMPPNHERQWLQTQCISLEHPTHETVWKNADDSNGSRSLEERPLGSDFQIRTGATHNFEKNLLRVRESKWLMQDGCWVVGVYIPPQRKCRIHRWSTFSNLLWNPRPPPKSCFYDSMIAVVWCPGSMVWEGRASCSWISLPECASSMFSMFINSKPQSRSFCHRYVWIFPQAAFLWVELQYQCTHMAR